MTLLRLLPAAALSLALGSAVAAPVNVQSYSTANGHGQAIGGAYNYWDKCYGGVCDKSTDGQLLAGGTGDLTDGVVATRGWASVEKVAGTGPYVGWHRDATPLVSIDFHFDGFYDIDSLAIHADDANGKGSVSLPASVRISWAGGSASFDVQDPPSASPLWLTFSGLGITDASEINLQLTHRTKWIFVDEVRFDGTMVSQLRNGQIPEPPTFALAGLALLGLRTLRRGGAAGARP